MQGKTLTVILFLALAANFVVGLGAGYARNGLWGAIGSASGDLSMLITGWIFGRAWQAIHPDKEEDSDVG